jgi:hypothetical protein
VKLELKKKLRSARTSLLLQGIPLEPFGEEQLPTYQRTLKRYKINPFTDPFVILRTVISAVSNFRVLCPCYICTNYSDCYFCGGSDEF